MIRDSFPFTRPFYYYYNLLYFYMVWRMAASFSCVTPSSHLPYNTTFSLSSFPHFNLNPLCSILPPADQ